MAVLSLAHVLWHTLNTDGYVTDGYVTDITDVTDEYVTDEYVTDGYVTQVHITSTVHISVPITIAKGNIQLGKQTFIRV